MKDDEYIASLIKKAGFDKPSSDLSDAIMDRIWLEPTYKKMPNLISTKAWIAVSLAMLVTFFLTYLFGELESNYIFAKLSNFEIDFVGAFIEHNSTNLAIIATSMAGLLVLLIIDRYLRNTS
tara:strand:- start:61 stop:426 length:366 start_codon:yes stop_codon:yes gene_type:complete